MAEPVLPEHGMGRTELLDAMRSMGSDDGDWRNGRMFGLVYYIDPEHAELIRQAYAMFIFENCLLYTSPSPRDS